MFETHVALVVATVALVVAARRQKRLPTYRLEWNDISAQVIHVKRLFLESYDGERHLEFYIDNEGSPEILLPSEIIEGERYQASMRVVAG